MASKRPKRRAPAPAPSPARRASPRVLAIAAGAIALVVLAVVLALVLTGGSDDEAAAPATALPEATEVAELLDGIPQDANALGEASAPVTLVEYVDLQCPFCRDFETQVMPALIADYVRPGQVRVESRVLAFIGEESVLGRRAALAAGLQDRMSHMEHLLYLNQGAENSGWLTDELVEAAAASMPGLDVEQFREDLESDSLDEQGRTFEQLATEDAVEQTPTVLVGRTGEELERVELTSATDAAAVTAAIEAALG